MLRTEWVAGHTLARIARRTLPAARPVVAGRMCTVTARESGMPDLANPVGVVKFEPENNARACRVSNAESLTCSARPQAR